MPGYFFAGRVTFTRFQVEAGPKDSDGLDRLGKLHDAAIGKQKIATADGSEVGWIAGEHILDTRFDREKNVVNGAMHFALRADEQKPPAALLKAYTAIELAALAASNSNGIPSAQQKREAKATAKERIEEEAKDGRFRRRTAVPVLWDSEGNELLIGSTSATAINRVYVLFLQTFGCRFAWLGAGRRAAKQFELHGASPAFGDDIAWQPDDSDKDFLGNEFLLWLWYYLENVTDTIKLGDGSEVAVMLARTLALECPRGQTGKDTITSEGPAKQPEALRAIQAGKLPRRAGMTLVRYDQQYELTLHAETLAIASARLPSPEAEDARGRLEERVTQLRHLRETVDLMYVAFLERRLDVAAWGAEVSRMHGWLGRREAA